MSFLFFISIFVYLCSPCSSDDANLILKGMYPPVFTPFDDRGAVDTSVLDDYAQYLSENGAKGVIVSDSTGEGPNLSESERKLLFKCWKSVAKKYGLSMIAQIGGGSEGEMINLAKYCEQLKVDMITMLPTVYFKPKTIEELVQLVEAVSKAASSLPIQYIDYTRFTKLELDMAEFFSIATKRIPNFSGLIVDLATAVQVAAVNKLKPYQTLCIRDHILVSAAVFLGFRCFTTTVINVYPLAMANLIKHALDGDIAMAKEGQMAYNNITAQIVKQGNMLSSNKAAMKIYTGIDVGIPRLPIQPLSEQAKKNVKAITDDIDNIPSLNAYELTPEDLKEI